jgi:hypothetical protein
MNVHVVKTVPITYQMVVKVQLILSKNDTNV